MGGKGSGWSKGLTKEVDERVRKMGRSISKSKKGKFRKINSVLFLRILACGMKSCFIDLCKDRQIKNE